MQQAFVNQCACVNCPGAACTCGCQQRAQPQACGCGLQVALRAMDKFWRG